MDKKVSLQQRLQRIEKRMDELEQRQSELEEYAAVVEADKPSDLKSESNQIKSQGEIVASKDAS